MAIQILARYERTSTLLVCIVIDGFSGYAHSIKNYALCLLRSMDNPGNKKEDSHVKQTHVKPKRMGTVVANFDQNLNP